MKNLDEVKIKVGDLVDFIGFFEGNQPQKIMKIEEITLENGDSLIVYHLSIGFGDIKYLSKDSLKLWQPKDSDWIVPNYNISEQDTTITIHKVKEIVQVENQRKNVAVCYDGRTFSCDMISPIYFSAF